MRTDELLDNTAPGPWAWLGLAICIVLGLILALYIAFIRDSRKRRLERLDESRVGGLDPDVRRARSLIPEKEIWEYEKMYRAHTRLERANCAQIVLVFLVAVVIFYNVGAWDLTTGGSSASKVSDKIEADYALSEVGWQGPGIQGHKFNTRDGEPLSLDVSGDQIGFEDATGKSVDMAQYERLSKAEAIAYIKETTVLESPVVDNLTKLGKWESMPSLKDLGGTTTDPLLVVKGTVNGQVVTVNIASKGGRLTGALAESSGRGFDADEVFR